MKPQIGMMLHYRPLDGGLVARHPQPALVMGVHEVPGGQPNLDLTIFEANDGPPSFCRRVPPSCDTSTGSGWEWPEWMITAMTYEPGPRPAFTRPAPLLNADLGRLGDSDTTRTAADGAQTGEAAARQSGAVVVLVLAGILLSGLVTSLIAAGVSPG